jgi:succinyl-diaminopimelate desuccinylase
MPARPFRVFRACLGAPPGGKDAAMPTDPIALASALIRVPSVTPDAGGAIALLAERLAAAGFEAHRPVFEEAGAAPVENLYARIGSGAPALVLAGHVDVVPPGDPAAWTHGPFSGVVVDGQLHGRGAVDMKGGVAAAVASALDHIEAHGAPRRGSIVFLITGDEEGPAVNGTVKLLDWAKRRGEIFSHCLLGEPTNPGALGEMMKIGRRGSLSGTVTVEGVQGHVAYPHLAENPVPALCRIAIALQETPLDRGTERFDPSNLEITALDVAEGAANMIPGSARARFNVRFNDLWTPETLGAEIARRAAAAAGGARHRVAFEPTNALAFVTEPGPFSALVADAIEAETGWRPALSTTGGTSDARFIRAHCEVIEFGLVGATMHKVDERTDVADLVRLTAIYRRVIEAYLADR